jgi:hypothetical protein
MLRNTIARAPSTITRASSFAADFDLTKKRAFGEIRRVA